VKTNASLYLAAGLLVAGSLAGQSQAPQAKPAQTKASAADSKFVQNASAGGMAEVQMGELAKQKASESAVKDFAAKMVMDHTKANDELKAIASQEGMSLATTLNAKDKALYDRLSGMSGAQFDQAYMNAMVTDHRQDVAEFQKEAKSGQNPKLKEFAMKTLPTLEEHLKMAQTTATTVKTKGKPKG
jgi:putative membrane protein